MAILANNGQFALPHYGREYAKYVVLSEVCKEQWSKQNVLSI